MSRQHVFRLSLGCGEERFQLRLGEEAPTAGLQPLKSQGADRHAAKLSNPVSHRLEHPAHLLLPAFPKFEEYPCGITAAVHSTKPDARGQGSPAEEGHAAAEPLQRRLLGNTVDQSQIHLRHLVARMRQLVRQIAVVGEEQQPLGLRIQTTHRMNSLHAGIILAEASLERRDDEVHHGLGGVRILPGGDVAGGLVQHQVESRNLKIDALSVDGHPVGLRVNSHARVRHGLSVDGHFTSADQLHDVSPCSDATRGEHLL